jgi:hypothetical protein
LAVNPIFFILNIKLNIERRERKKKIQLFHFRVPSYLNPVMKFAHPPNIQLKFFKKLNGKIQKIKCQKNKKKKKKKQVEEKKQFKFTLSAHYREKLYCLQA